MCVTRSQDFFSQRTGGAGVNDIVGKKKGKKKKCKYDKSTNVILLKKKKKILFKFIYYYFLFFFNHRGVKYSDLQTIFLNFLNFFYGLEIFEVRSHKMLPV